MATLPSRPVAVRGAVYLLGALALTAAWSVVLWAVFHPPWEVWTRPDLFPVVAATYLAGTYAIWVGGALYAWRCVEGRPWGELGLSGWRWRHAAEGLAWGLGSLGGLLALELGLGWVQWGPAAWAHTHASALVAAAVTAVFFGATEELVFRGFVYRLLRDGRAAGGAIACSGAFYALVHFLRLDLGWAQVVTPFLGLWLAGSLLAWTVERTGSLAFATGLHAGWVYLFFLADRQHLVGYPPALNWLTGGGFPLGGALALVMMAILGGLLRLRRL